MRAARRIINGICAGFCIGTGVLLLVVGEDTGHWADVTPAIAFAIFGATFNIWAAMRPTQEGP